MNRDEAETLLSEWAAINNRRDEFVRAARQAGVSKNRIHVLTGIARTTIDRILEAPMAQATPAEITEFLDRFTASWPRYHPHQHPMFRPQPAVVYRHSAEEVARTIFEDAEFQALNLGTFLNTPDGELLGAAVKALTPPPYQMDIELLIEALQLAAQMQQDDVRETFAKRFLGALALGVIAVGVARS